VATAVAAHDHAEHPESFRPPDVRTIDRLGRRDVIVVIDNCEHVAAAAASCVRTLLVGCPRLTIIATSREPLGVEAERQLNLPSLDDADATRLFAERARAVQPSFSADADDTVAALCRRLDGLPLAIELAAARTKTLPLPEIAARLDDRFALLRSTSRDGGGRHHGLGATIDWSYELLFDDERRVFRQLAVFAGGATVDAAEVLCGDDALDILTRLVDRSLLIADTSGDESRRPPSSTTRSPCTSDGAQISQSEPSDTSAASVSCCGSSALTANTTTCVPPSPTRRRTIRTVACA
jgi:predicted ATPase